MDDCGDTAKKGGRRQAAATQRKRTIRAAKKATRDKGRGAAGTVEEGRRNELIQREWRRGRDVPSLAAEFGIKPRRVYEIIKQCREGEIEALALNEPWRGQRFADELLVQKIAVVNDAREMELRMRVKGNAPVELGAFKARVRAINELATFLQETGRLRLRDLKDEAERMLIGKAMVQAFADYGIPDDAVRAIGRALGFEEGPEGEEPISATPPPPEHWSVDPQEIDAERKQRANIKRREDAEAELRREAEQRKEAQQRREGEERREAIAREEAETRHACEAREKVVRREIREQVERAEQDPARDSSKEDPVLLRIAQQEREVDAKRQREAEAERQREAEAERLLDPWKYAERARRSSSGGQ